jgi:hypothetical protein
MDINAKFVPESQQRAAVWIPCMERQLKGSSAVIK